MYWPLMHKQLTEAVQKCTICQEAQPAQTNEPMMTHPLPKTPWQVMGSDCFETGGQHYCVYVDIYSDYIEICELEDLTETTLVNKTKPVFATHGTPATLISDSGPNYASREFANFMQDWDISHVTSSPHHSK